MIEIGRFTGELLDGEYVMVEIQHGQVLPCRPVFSHPLISVPTQDWLDTYQDKFHAVIAFEEGFAEKPLLIGIIPYKNAVFPTEGYENNSFIISKNFRVWINDDDNKCTIQALNNGTILLGDQNVTEEGVLGSKNETALKELATKIDAIYNAILSAATNPTPDGGAAFKAAIIATLSGNGFPISAAFNQTALDTKSQTVKLK